MHLLVSISAFVTLLCASACASAPAASVSTSPPPSSTMVASTVSTPAPLPAPLLDPGRVTKKPFGIFITPQSSPVSPEKFRGYHTGADFELRVGEDPHALSVPAICDGTVVVARRATGYGGVLVQRCTLQGQAVTVLYGHLDPGAFAAKVGGAVKRGQSLGHLGKAYSSETDGERAHLHLSVHRGSAAVLLGYVQTKSALAAWMDPLSVL